MIMLNINCLLAIVNHTMNVKNKMREGIIYSLFSCVFDAYNSLQIYSYQESERVTRVRTDSYKT